MFNGKINHRNTVPFNKTNNKIVEIQFSHQMFKNRVKITQTKISDSLRAYCKFAGKQNSRINVLHACKKQQRNQ